MEGNFGEDHFVFNFEALLTVSTSLIVRMTTIRTSTQCSVIVCKNWLLHFLILFHVHCTLQSLITNCCTLDKFVKDLL